MCRQPWQGDSDSHEALAKGKVNSEGYVNVASELGMSGHRGYYIPGIFIVGLFLTFAHRLLHVPLSAILWWWIQTKVLVVDIHWHYPAISKKGWDGVEVISLVLVLLVVFRGGCMYIAIFIISRLLPFVDNHPPYFQKHLYSII